MKRKFKNFIMIVLIILMGVFSYFTMKDVQNTNSNMNIEQKEPKDMEENKTQPPEMPLEKSDSDEKMGEPPAKPDENSNNNTFPEMPPEGSNRNEDMGERPEKIENNESFTFKTIHYIMFGMESCIASVLIIYLILSKFNKLTLQETLNKFSRVIIFIMLVVIVTTVLTVIKVYLTNTLFKTEDIKQSDRPSNMEQMMPNKGENNSSASSATKTGKITIDGETENLLETYTTDTEDESVVLVQNGGNAIINGAEISKTGGDSSNTENSEFYGVNAGILVTENSTATIKDATITTNAKGSNAVFSTGTNSKIYISNSKITTTGSGSARGLDATYGGYIEADNVKITTLGGSCATLATDRGEETIIANNSNLETNGSGSPVIYSTGNISIENTSGTANGSQMVVIEGKNSATVTNSVLAASGKGNRGDVDQAGIMIYQSMSGDAGQGTGTFTASNSTLSLQEESEYYKTAPMFFITNTDAVINLTNCSLDYGSNILISSKGTSEWGKTGSNAGNVTLNAENQILEGDIEIDDISTLIMNLTTSTYKGKINAENTAKSISLKIDKNSSITLTGDSYVTSIEDEDTNYSNINFNGYKLYVNGVAIN